MSEAMGAIEAVDDPHRLAHGFLAAHRVNGQLTLRFYQGDWYRWRDGGYQLWGQNDVEAAITNAIRSEFIQVASTEAALRVSAGPGARPGRRPQVKKVTKALCGNVLAALKGLCIVSSDLAAPAWLDEPGPYAAAEILAAPNGHLHVPGYLAGEPQLLPPGPRLFSLTALDYAINLHAPPPVQWLPFLDSLWGNDPESITTLQEWFGYCLLPDTRQQKILFLIRPPRSGKGAILRVLRDLVGEDNVASPPLSMLATPFGLAALMGKTVACIPDARLSFRSDQAVVMERLLSISGEDSLTIDRKNRDPVTVRLPTRLMICSNELPNLRDASLAFANRLILLELTRSFLGAEDVGLSERLAGERAGVLLWALEGLKRLRARGHFEQPASGRAQLEQMAELSSPVQAFVKEQCERGPTLSVVRSRLFHAWESWCDEQGHVAGNSASFGRNLKAVFPEISSVRASGVPRLWQYVGIGLKDNRFPHLPGRPQPISPGVGLDTPS